MPDNRNLAVTAMLSLLDNKVHCLVTNLLTMKKVIPHQVLSGEISEGHRELNVNVRNKMAFTQASSHNQVL